VNEAQRLWDECAGILRAQVSEPVWLTSFEAARAVSLDGGLLTLAVPSFLAKERIEGRYLSLVRDALTEIGASDIDLAATGDEVEHLLQVIRRHRKGTQHYIPLGTRT